LTVVMPTVFSPLRRAGAEKRPVVDLGIHEQVDLEDPRGDAVRDEWVEWRKKHHREVLERRTYEEGRVAQKHLAVVAERERRIAGTEQAARRVVYDKWIQAESLREYKDRELHRNLAREMQDQPHASAEEIRAISLLLNKHLAQQPDSYGSRGWIKLFHMADTDRSGQIGYDEFYDLLRVTLGIPDHELVDDQIKVLFLTLDPDCSGLLSAGEFGQLMRFAEYKHAEEGHGRTDLMFRQKFVQAERIRRDRAQQARECRLTKLREEEQARREVAVKRQHEARSAQRAQNYVLDVKRDAANQLRREKAEIFNTNLAQELNDEPRASTEQVKEISEKLNRYLEIQPDSYGTRGWVKLFSAADIDRSGLISYDEFFELLRVRLRVPEHELPSEQIKILFMTLDPDGSGHISVGEFGQFMRSAGYEPKDPLSGKRSQDWTRADARGARRQAYAKQVEALRRARAAQVPRTKEKDARSERRSPGRKDEGERRRRGDSPPRPRSQSPRRRGGGDSPPRKAPPRTGRAVERNSPMRPGDSPPRPAAKAQSRQEQGPRQHGRHGGRGIAADPPGRMYARDGPTSDRR